LSILIAASLFAQPVLTVCNPDSGFQGSSIRVLVSGGGFTGPVPAPTASFGSGVTVTGVDYMLSTLLQVHLTIDVLAPVGPKDVIITNSDGRADTLFGGFTVS
jgi:hypothetical protein